MGHVTITGIQKGTRKRIACCFQLLYPTTRIQFQLVYEWTGSAEERKRRIRDDRIPAPASVIVSDLDLRDLYRNQLLTALDDATAEVNYQFRQRQRQREQEGKSNVIVDVTDTVDLMNQVYVACTKWFDMIDAGDIEKALELVRTEQRRESSLTP